MNIPLIDLQAQYESLKPEIDAAVSDTLSTTRFIGGEEVDTFAKRFAAFAGHEHAIPCGNGTDALELVLDAYGIGPGDEVIVPAMSWISTSEVVATRGAKPVFVDIDAASYCIDPEKVKAAVTPAIRAIIAVHLYGHPADLTALREVADHHELILIEDCAQAHGAKWAGEHVGTVGEAATYSFFPSKSLGAFGDGGLVGCDEEKMATIIRALANHGMPGRRHHHVYHGRNSRLDALQAAVLNVKLPHLADWIAAKNRWADAYRERLAGLDLTLPTTDDRAYHGYHLFVIKTPRRDALAKYLKQAGVATTVHYPTPLPLHDCYTQDGLEAEDYPVAVDLSRTALSLPMYAEMGEDNIDYICERIKVFFGA